MTTHEHDEPGARLRRARSAREVSQTALARRLGISASYLSLIEAGRRPPPEGLLTSAAAELGVDPEMLRTGSAPDPTPDPASEAAALELELRFAEMVFRTGDPGAAQARFDAALAAAQVLHRTDLAATALWGRGRCREGVGDADGALADYEQLWSQAHLPPDLDRAWLGVALCRVYRDVGDMARSVEVGENALRILGDAPDRDVSFDSQVALTMTLAGTYGERGDLARAHQLVTATLAKAETGRSAKARGAVYWQAAVLAEERGDLPAARRYVDRAVALYGEGDNELGLASVRVLSGWLSLQGVDPDVRGAQAALRAALADDTVRGDAMLSSIAKTELARALVMDGRPLEALDLASAAVDRLADGELVQRAYARLVLGHAHLSLGDEEVSLTQFRLAAQHLDATGAPRQAAAAWRELAESMTVLGRAEEALVAYRRATDAAGVRAPSTPVAPISTHSS